MLELQGQVVWAEYGVTSMVVFKVDRERYRTKANVNKVRVWSGHGGAQSQGWPDMMSHNITTGH